MKVVGVVGGYILYVIRIVVGYIACVIRIVTLYNVVDVL